MGVHLRRTHVLAAILVVLGFALLLPGRGAPMQAAAADTVTVTMSAPTNVLVGNWIDYTITLTYSGVLTDQTADYTFTDALPAQVRFLSLGISAGTCPTPPPSGQNGTVACTFKFAPLTKTITIHITVETTATGSVTNNGQLSSGGTASATTSVDPPPAGSITAIDDGAGDDPAQLDRGAAALQLQARSRLHRPADQRGRLRELRRAAPRPDEQPGRRSRNRTGAPRPVQGRRSSQALRRHALVQLLLHRGPPHPNGPAVGEADGEVRRRHERHRALDGRHGDLDDDGPRSASGPGAVGAARPVAGPPAAPTTTVAETFTKAGAAEPETVSISPTAETVQVALTWPNSGSSFDAIGFTLTTRARGRWPSSSEKLRVTKKRGAKWLDVRIKGVHNGKLKFKIVARRVHGRTRVVAKVRQSKR